MVSSAARSDEATGSFTVMGPAAVVSLLAWVALFAGPWTDLFGEVQIFDVVKTGCSVTLHTPAPFQTTVAFGLLVAAFVAAPFPRWHTKAFGLAAAAATVAGVSNAIYSSEWLDASLRGTYSRPTCPPAPGTLATYLTAQSIYYDVGVRIVVVGTLFAIAQIALKDSWRDPATMWPLGGRVGFRTRPRHWAGWALVGVFVVMTVILAGYSLSVAFPVHKTLALLVTLSLMTLVPYGPLLRLGRAMATATVANAFAQYGTIQAITAGHENAKLDVKGNDITPRPDISADQLQGLHDAIGYYLIVLLFVGLILLAGWFLRRTLYRDGAPSVAPDASEGEGEPSDTRSLGGAFPQPQSPNASVETQRMRP